MYNRYVRNDFGVYERVSAAQSHAPHAGSKAHQEPPSCPPPKQDTASPLSSLAGKNGLLSGILGKLKLDAIDTGDLLLLVILFLLFRDGEDEELLIALGLLLIL